MLGPSLAVAGRLIPCLLQQCSSVIFKDLATGLFCGVTLLFSRRKQVYTPGHTGYLHSSVINSILQCNILGLEGTSVSQWWTGPLPHISTHFSSGNAGTEVLQRALGVLYLELSQGQNGQDVQVISITLPGGYLTGISGMLCRALCYEVATSVHHLWLELLERNIDLNCCGAAASPSCGCQVAQQQFWELRAGSAALPG